MVLNLIQGGVEILLVASCCRNWDKLQADGPLGSYEDFTLYLVMLLLPLSRCRTRTHSELVPKENSSFKDQCLFPSLGETGSKTFSI